MTLRSTIDIEVNDATFRQFKAQFDRYQSAVARLPGDWSKIGAAVSDSRKSFNDLVAQMVHQNLIASQYNAAQIAADRLVKSQVQQWKSIARSTGDIVKTVVRATENLIKWVGPVAIVTGLLGAAGGLFGLDRLAMSAAGGRRGAMGLGTTYGQMAAFGLDYGPLIDAHSLLGNVSRGIYNKTSPQYSALLAAGITPQFIAGHNAAETAIEFLHHLPDQLASQPRGFMGAINEQRFSSIISNEDMIAYLGASPRERNEREASWTKDARSLDVNNPTQRAYQDFITQLDRAGKQIEVIFVRGLSSLAEPLGRVSKALVKLVNDIAGSDNFKHFMDSVGGVIESLAAYIQSPEFEKKVEDFGDWLGQMAGTLRWAVEQLIAIGGGVKHLSTPNELALGVGRRPGRGAAPGSFGGRNPVGAGNSNLAVNKPRTAEAMKAAMSQLRAEGVPETNLRAAAAILVGQAIGESNLNPTLSHDSGTGYGVYGARLARRDRMLSWLSANGYSSASLEGQMKYMAHEAMTSSDYAPTRNALMGASAETLSQGELVARQNFESPGVPRDEARLQGTNWAFKIGTDGSVNPVNLGTAMSDDYGDLRVRGSSGSTTEPIGGGPAARGLIDLAHWLQDTDPSVGQFTAFHDRYHVFGNPSSYHNKGLAFDATLSGESIDDAANRVRREMAQAGLVEGDLGGSNGDFAIEPSAMAGNHLHVQFNSVDAAERFYAWRHKPASFTQVAANKAMYIGDSIAVGLMGAAHAEGMARVSASPAQVLGFVKNFPSAADAKTSTVVISAGASNDYSAGGFDAIQKTIAALKGLGYMNIILAGVGNRADFAREHVNERLSALANGIEGVTFAGAIDPRLLTAEGVHPNYAGMLRDEIAPNFAAPISAPIRTVTLRKDVFDVHQASGVPSMVGIYNNLGSGAQFEMSMVH